MTDLVLTKGSQQQFTEIYGEIEAISMRYFHDIEDKVTASLISGTFC